MTDVNALFDQIFVTAGGDVLFGVAFFNTSDSLLSSQVLQVPVAGIRENGINATLDEAIANHAVNAGYNVLGTFGKVPVGLLNSPQSAIANAPADAVTNYNVVTTLLGALTGAVNAANTKQNEIAAKLNLVLAVLRTEGLITT